MNENKVLVIEDDADINEIVAARLRKSGYACTQAFSGTEARLLLERDRFDVVVTDLMLPGMVGEEIVEHIRSTDAATPIVVISARTAATDKVDLLRLGVDDYMAKPFDLNELIARIEVQLRHRGLRGVSQKTSVLRFRTWSIDREARTLTASGEPVSLTRIEFDIVELLVTRPDKVFTKRELFELVWNESYAACESTLNVHVSNIRAKLKASGTDSYIKTVWGLGFKLS